MRGVESVHAVSEYAADKFEVSEPPAEPLLALMRDEESGLAAFWVTWRGKGTVIVSGYGSIFTNKMLAQAGNAQLASNIIAAGVGPGGHVIFEVGADLQVVQTIQSVLRSKQFPAQDNERSPLQAARRRG